MGVVKKGGSIRWAGRADADAENRERNIAGHVHGACNKIRAAWSHMVDAGYGRIVNTTSSGVCGLPQNLSYATAKGGVIGMTRSLATAGGEHGIKAKDRKSTRLNSSH